MAEIHFLGTCGSVPTPERDNASFLLSWAGGLALIDCPGSVVAKIAKAGFSPLQVASVFITHIHPDHVYGLPSLVHSLMLREHRFRLFGSAETVRFTASLLDLFGLREAKIKTRVEFVPLEAGGRLAVADGLEVTALQTPHHTSSLAFDFLADDSRRVLFTGDTPLFPPLLERGREADVLVHDCGAPSRFFEEYPVLRTMHTSALDLGRACRDMGIPGLVPVHFLMGDFNFEASEIDAEVRGAYPGRLLIPVDGDVMSL